MKLSLTSLVFALIILAALPTAAQTPPPDIGDKTGGEMEQILQRELWFARTRGLDKLERPDLLRARAVESARAMRAAAADRDGLDWEPLGPDSMTMFDWDMGNVSGRVAALAVHPTDEDTIYLGAASGGLWKTINGGASWTAIFDQVGTQTIGAIFIDPGDPNTVWVGTGEQGQYCSSYFGLGLFKSTNGGQSWVPMNGTVANPLDLSYVSTIAVHPSNSQLVLVGGHGYCNSGSYNGGGLFRSTDGGANWTKVLAGPVTDLLIDPNTPNTMYLGVGRGWGWSSEGVHKSIDGGLTWNQFTQAGNGIPSGTSVGRIRLAMAPSNSQILYALVSDNANSGSTLYKTINGGTTWTSQNTTACEGQCSYDLCLAVHPDTPTTLLVGSIRHFVSTDSGVTLVDQTGSWGRTQKVHQDTHVLLYSRTNGNRYWAAGDGGVWRTDNHGSTFTNLNANLNITQYYDIAVHPSDEHTVFGGAQDNSSSRTNGSTLWDVSLSSGDGFMNLVDPANPSNVFQTSYPYWDGVSSYWPSLAQSLSGGAPGTFNWLSTFGVGFGEHWDWVVPMAIIDPDEPTPTALFMASQYVYRSTSTSPTTWTKISPDLTGGGSHDQSVILTPTLVGSTVVLYAGTTDGRIWRCDDALVATPTFNNVTGNFPGSVTDIAVDPMNHLRVFATFGSFGQAKLWLSTTGGTNWAAVGTNIPDAPANTVAIDPAGPQRVFVGTDVGVYESTDGGLNFAAAMNGLPLGTVITDLEVDDSPHYITAGTYGRGAWQAQLSEDALIFADGFESGDTSRW